MGEELNTVSEFLTTHVMGYKNPSLKQTQVYGNLGF